MVFIYLDYLRGPWMAVCNTITKTGGSYSDRKKNKVQKGNAPSAKRVLDFENIL